MKEDFDDIAFKRLLQEKAHKPGENPWFTRRVLNRLPEKTEAGNFYTIERWTYIIGMVLCIVFWGALYVTGFFDVITVRSLIYIIALTIGSFGLMIQTIRTIFTA